MFQIIKKTVFFLIVLFLILSLIKNMFEFQQKQYFFNDFKKEYQSELNHNKKLKSDILKNQDYYYLEKNIREKLNLLQRDEIAVIIPKPTPNQSPVLKTETIPLLQWWNLFFH